ncbi:DUF4367 domain-containing protein [Paenibacillus sp. 481]|uniref:DUF4367 domain-containing protein n=1 Tax=Paenibacillus sp. 481 TaxID=2835869 RepID=UPI001E3DBB29|nr:DUF4367 domain-containing protein [Paenibacillus sp. 481]UHA71999.1 DUF4367 domain-containing protein [Paenibacillus sp. 481]
MRRFTWLLAIVMSVALLLSGCGKKDATAVVEELDQVMTKLDSYAGIGTMTLNSGQQPLQYQVEVWYQDPSYYRIELTNAKKDVKQIVLRNEEGVFVLTPSLNKSFRFQSDWPENQGQVYLYQTLVRSIMADKNRQFTTDGDSYVFEVAANYQTDTLVRQKIWLNKGNYAPSQIQVTDAEGQVVVEMKFNQFDFGKKFDKEQFDMQRNMTSSRNADSIPTAVDQPTMATPEPTSDGTSGDQAVQTPVVPDGADKGTGVSKPAESSEQGEATKPTESGEQGKATKPTETGEQGEATKPTETGEQGEATKPTESGEQGKANKPTETGEQGEATKPTEAGEQGEAAKPTVANKSSNGKQKSNGQPDIAPSAQGPFGFIEPSYIPEGVALKDKTEVPNSTDHAVMLRYTGTYNFTIMESRPKDVEVGLIYGQVVDLGFTIGQMTGDEQKTLTWMYDGVKYRVVSAEMPTDEMVKTAQSMIDQSGK